MITLKTKMIITIEYIPELYAEKVKVILVFNDRFPTKDEFNKKMLSEGIILSDYSQHIYLDIDFKVYRIGTIVNNCILALRNMTAVPSRLEFLYDNNYFKRTIEEFLPELQEYFRTSETVCKNFFNNC